VKLSSLKELDSSFSIVSGEANADVKGVCDKHSFFASGIYFCKNQKFQDFAENNISPECKFGIVFESLPKDFNQGDYLFVATVKSIPKALCLFSEHYYLKKVESCNDEVDGRQMGTVDIHPSVLISQNVFIGKDVVIGKGSRIHPHVTLMSGSRVGKDCEIFPGTVFHPGVTIGDRVRIAANCTLASDGFGYHYENGVHHKIYHLGGVVVGDDVEFGPGCTIDQGTFSPTLIGDGSKLDNQVHVAHNVHLGKGVILCGQVGVAGSAKVGDFCVFGGKAGLGPDCELGAGCEVAGNAMVVGDWPAKTKLGGHPARPLREWMKGIAYVRKLSLAKGK